MVLQLGFLVVVTHDMCWCRWSSDGHYFARMSQDTLSIYETPVRSSFTSVQCVCYNLTLPVQWMSRLCTFDWHKIDDLGWHWTVGITGHQMKRLQSIQNAAARLIVGASTYDAITPTLRDLHWLPVRQRIDFKIGVLAYKCQHGMAPLYLTAMLVPAVSLQQRQRLRSSSTSTLLLPRMQTHYGDRNFAVAGPAAWNCLSAELRRPDLSWLCFVDYWRTRYSLLRTLTISALGAMR